MLIQWFQKGGIFMWPLLFCSLLGLAAILDRLAAHWYLRLDFSKFLKKLRADLGTGLKFLLPKWVEQLKSPVAEITKVYFAYQSQDEKIRNEALKREGGKLLKVLDKRMRLISALAAVTPLLGLLGTVTGLVLAFYSIELKGGMVQPGDLAGGIWEALLTTVFGLTIGIPCLLAYQYFQAKTDNVAAAMSEIISELDEIKYLKENSEDTDDIIRFESYGS